MANYEIIIPTEIPKYVISAEAARIANEEAAAGISTGMPARIKLMGKQFCLVDGTGEETPVMPAKLTPGPDGNTYLRMVILRAKKALQKTWFASAYNPNEEGKQPDCFSLDGERPDGLALAKQAETCAACPHNAFGSGKDQSGNPTKGKACSDKKILAVFVPGVGATPADCIFSMALPAASLKNFGLYVKKLSASGIPLGTVLTLAGFDLTASHPVLVFQFGGFLPEAHMPKLAEMSVSLEVEEILGGMAPKALPASAAQVASPAVADIDLGLDVKEADAAKRASAEVEEKAQAEAAAKAAATKKAKADAAAKAKATAEANKKAAAEAAAKAAAQNTDLGLDLGLGDEVIDLPPATAAAGSPSDADLMAELGLM